MGETLLVRSTHPTFADLVTTSQRVAETRSRLAKVGLLSECLKRLARDEIAIGVDYLSGRLPQGRIGVGYGLISQARRAYVDRPELSVKEVDEIFARVSATTGPGSTAQRQQLLASLFARATRAEQDFLVRLVLGDLRQGALDGLMAEAIAQAASVPAVEVRRALMVSGDLAAVAQAALTQGSASLAQFKLQVLKPVQPMLAQPADDMPAALAQLQQARLEYKLDGARVQVHKADDEVRVFTRALNEVTASVPEIVEAVRQVKARALILDGEAIALRPDGTPLPFQITMRRFGRKQDIETQRMALPLTVFFFDCLHIDGQDLIAHPSQARFTALQEVLPPALLIPHRVTADTESAQAFLAEALALGHEGVMAKALDGPYEAGNRGSRWLKIKQTHTLDLVVLAAEWGNGRRQGWLSNLHLGARDPQQGGFVMLGKTFKGMTDVMLAMQTQKLRELAIGTEGHIVHVRPEFVVEVAFNDLQASPHYPGGLALRFARIKRYRPDKPAAQADTIDTVRGLYARQVQQETKKTQVLKL